MSLVPVPSPALVFRALRAFGQQISLSVACLSVVGVCQLAAQNSPGTLDTSFTTPELGFTYYTQVLETLNGIPRLFVGGDRFGLALLELNGVDDTTDFVEPDIGNAARIVYTAVPEKVAPPTGTTPYILIGGQFGRSLTQAENKQTSHNILRLTPAGDVDMTFNVSTKGTNNFVTSIVPLAGSDASGNTPSGDIIVGGLFTTFNDVTHQYIVRLDHNGNPLDGSGFNALSFDAPVLSLALQQPYTVDTEAQVLVAGQFSNVNNAKHNKLARINADGSVDATFNPTFDDRTTVVVSQPDGKILVGGDFENVNGVPAKHIVRLNSDGTVDQTFTASVTGQPFGFVDPPAVYVIQLLNDGSMYLGGNFTTVNGVTRNYLALVDSTGALDPSFDPGKTIINAVQSLTVQPDGRLLVGENVSKKNGNNVQPASLIRLYGQAAVINLAPGVSALNGTPPAQEGTFTLSRDGRVTTAGSLTVYIAFSGKAKLGTDYAVPSILTPQAAADGSVVYAVTFSPGQSAITIPIDPLRMTFKNGHNRKITLTVVDDPTNAASYTPGSSATITIGNP